MKSTERIEESLCEKSMKVVSNVIKMSALSMAKRSLASTAGNSVAPRNSRAKTTSSIDIVPIKPLLRAQQPQTNTKQTYLVEPQVGNTKLSSSSSYVVKEDTNVDGRASDYIRKVREKNQNGTFVSFENSSSRVLQSRVVN